METQLHYDLAQKQLNFKLREHITSKPGVELRGKGYFNTTTASLSYVGTLTASVRAGEEVKDSGSKPFKLTGGVLVASSTDSKVAPRPQLHLKAKKQISLLEGPRTVLSAKAHVNLDPQNGKTTAKKATLKLSHKWLGFTARQDLKLSCGVDADWTTRVPELVPFVQIKENNWAANYRQLKCFLTYDL